MRFVPKHLRLCMSPPVFRDQSAVEMHWEWQRSQLAGCVCVCVCVAQALAHLNQNCVPSFLLGFCLHGCIPDSKFKPKERLACGVLQPHAAAPSTMMTKAVSRTVTVSRCT